MQQEGEAGALPDVRTSGSVGRAAQGPETVELSARGPCPAHRNVCQRHSPHTPRALFPPRQSWRWLFLVSQEVTESPVAAGGSHREPPTWKPKVLVVPGGET